MSLAEFGDSPTPRAQPAPLRADSAQQPTHQPSAQEQPRGSGDIIQWACFSDDCYMAAPNTTTRLPPAAYGFVPTQAGLKIVTKKLVVDELLEFPDSRQ